MLILLANNCCEQIKIIIYSTFIVANSDKEELEVLRERLPSVAKALNQVAENPADIKTGMYTHCLNS